MARKGGLTAIAIKNLGARDSRYEVPDPACPGLYLQVHPSGAKSWCYRFRFAGKSRKLTIGGAYTEQGIELIKIGDARDIADEARVSVARRIDPIEVRRERRKMAEADAAASEHTLRAVAGRYLDQCTDLRSIDARKNVFARLIYPALGNREIESIKRSDIVKLLDEVAKTRGPVMADYTLATLRRLLSWHAIRSDDYASPIMRGMARTSTKERARSRVLSEIELRAFWRACNEAGIFGWYLQFTLLTATRRNEAAHLRRSEIDGADWTIPASRYKTKIDHMIPLSVAAVAVLAKVPKAGDFIFATSDGGPMTGFGERKEKFDAVMQAQLRKLADYPDVDLERWTIHDLRRTARTMMSQLRIPSEVAEACLGHVIRGVEGTYNRHSYSDEKREAFEKLGGLVGRIVNNPSANVVALRRT